MVVLKYLNATLFQRFFAYFIDFLLIELIASLFISFIPAYEENYKVVLEFIKSFAADTAYDFDGLTQVLKSCLIVFAINYGILSIFILLYMVLLPVFWSKQTIGRAAMGIKVVRKNPTDPMHFGYFCLRELVGGLLLTNILGGSIIVLIINVVFCSSYGRSIGDYASGTRLINARFIPEEDPVEFEFKPEQKEDYIDAEVHEYNDQPSQEPEEENSDYKVY